MYSTEKIFLENLFSLKTLIKVNTSPSNSQLKGEVCKKGIFILHVMVHHVTCTNFSETPP